MNKLAFLIVAIFAVAAVANVAQDAKVANNPQIANIRGHIKALLAKIARNRRKATAAQKANASHCTKWIAKHKQVALKARQSIKSDKATIVATKKIQKVITESKIPNCEKMYNVYQEKKDGMTQKLEAGDEKRKAAQEKFDALLQKLGRHLAFVKKLYIFLMKSTVERRRSVKFLEEKASQMSKHAATMKGKNAAMMQTGATLMAQGHLDAVYRLLDNLRGKLQREIRSAKRTEMRAARHWIREHSRLRAKQIHYHKMATHWSEQSSKLELKDEHMDMANEKLTRMIENNDLIADHRERNLRVLTVSCKRSAYSYKTRINQWAAEVKALKELRRKINSHYKR